MLSSLSDQGNQHLTEIEIDLAQTNVLLEEAIDKLSASFMAIHEAVRAQQETVDLLLAGGAPTPELVAKLQATTEQVGLHVNSAVTGLQFQDMTSQLIGRTVRRVVGLRDVLGLLGTSSAAIPMNCNAADMIVLLNKINKTLDAQNTQLDGELRKAVCQTHMESGDIELF
jgi:hypothetical protein